MSPSKGLLDSEFSTVSLGCFHDNHDSDSDSVFTSERSQSQSSNSSKHPHVWETPFTLPLPFHHRKIKHPIHHVEYGYDHDQGHGHATVNDSDNLIGVNQALSSIVSFNFRNQLSVKSDSPPTSLLPPIEITCDGRSSDPSAPPRTRKFKPSFYLLDHEEDVPQVVIDYNREQTNFNNNFKQASRYPEDMRGVMPRFRVANPDFLSTSFTSAFSSSSLGRIDDDENNEDDDETRGSIFLGSDDSTEDLGLGFESSNYTFDDELYFQTPDHRRYDVFKANSRNLVGGTRDPSSWIEMINGTTDNKKNTGQFQCLLCLDVKQRKSVKCKDVHQLTQGQPQNGHLSTCSDCGQNVNTPFSGWRKWRKSEKRRTVSEDWTHNNGSNLKTGAPSSATTNFGKTARQRSKGFLRFSIDLGIRKDLIRKNGNEDDDDWHRGSSSKIKGSRAWKDKLPFF
ncbi:uncharacterized protein IL334_002632 [Kwoniella shivajii]|uniref:Uncharacterized protein n=1 Tax=Kwoniella shivajii TaxID=564305 RepID=A0ABZ1CWG5_9TREE|nr:hypothetical protein IL334_002632 [Kwoniella shivajii]